MTKQIFLNLKGMIEIECIVSSTFSKTYYGNAQIRSNETKRELFKRAVLDCVFQHLKERGKVENEFINYNIPETEYKVLILDYDIKYLGEKDLIKISRRKRKGKYYTYVTDRKTGKIITFKKWTYERNLEKYDF